MTDTRLDTLLKYHTAFDSFEQLLTARGNYRPTIELSDYGRVQLAAEYDRAMTARNDPRRAYTYRNESMRQDQMQRDEREAYRMQSAHLMGATQTAYGPNDSITVYSNQAEREACVLAVIKDQILVEYEMPNGTSALLQMTVDGRNLIRRRNVNYNTVPRRWLNAIRRADMTDWLGMGQRSATRIPFPAE